MGSEARKSYRIHIFCSILVVAFLVCIPVISAWTGAVAGTAGETGAAEIKADPLGRLPSSPEEARKRVQERRIGWPGDLAGAGSDRSAGAVLQGVRVSIPYDTVSGQVSTVNGDVRVELIRGGVTTQTVNRKADGGGVFTADLSLGDVQSGDIVRVTDVTGGGQVEVDCTLAGSIDPSGNTVSGSSAAGTSVEVYVCAPSTIMGDVPPGAAKKMSSGPSWSADFTGTLDLRTGDTAFIYAVDPNRNTVMDVARTDCSLVVYPQYDYVLGFGPVSREINITAGSANGSAGSAKDGFFEVWFDNHNIVPGEMVTCDIGTGREITVADITAKCDPATNRVSGRGPANRAIRVTMDPYGGSPAVYQSTTDAQGRFNVALGAGYTADGSDVYNVAWYDSDDDAVVYEFQTHSWHLAEGYTGTTPGDGWFDTYVLIQNPGVEDAEVSLTFQVQDGSADALAMTVAGGTRATVRLDELPGLEEASVSTKVTSTNGAAINAERAMYFSYEGKKGGHDSIGTLTPGTTWYLAEGYTGITPGGGGFDTWVLVQNPGNQAAKVKMSFQLDAGTAPDYEFDLAAGTRESVHLNKLPGLAGVSVSTRVTASVPVVAERAMYFDYEGKVGGHDSIGVKTPRKQWYLAEGYTGLTPGGGGFDTWLLVQNSGAQAANVTMSFQLDQGTAPDYNLTVPAGARKQVHLDDLPGLDHASVSTHVTSNVDIVVERSMYFSYEGKMGGHHSWAADELSRGWYLPEGYTGGTPGGGSFDTWVLVQNPGNSTARVTMSFQLDEGTAPDYEFTLAAGTRESVHLNKLPGLAGVSVSTRVTSSVPVVAERAVYFDYYGLDGGHDSIGISFAP